MKQRYTEGLDELARLEHLRRLRNWCFGLSFVALATAIESIGGWGIANPKKWTSFYEALAAAGELRWLFVPFSIIGIALLIVAVGLCVFVSRREPDA